MTVRCVCAGVNPDGAESRQGRLVQTVDFAGERPIQVR